MRVRREVVLAVVACCGIVAAFAEQHAVPPSCIKLDRGFELGTASIKSPNNASSAAACCSLCWANPSCQVFSFSNKSKHPVVCTLNTKLGSHNKTKSWVTSGVVRGPPPPLPAPTPSPDLDIEAYKRRVGLIQRAPLAFGAVTQTQNATAVILGELFELSVNLTATFDNPYNASEVALDANFTVEIDRVAMKDAGDGILLRTSYAVPGFFYTPFSMSGIDRDGVGGRGAPSWRVRFAPRVVGNWTVVLTARDRSGTIDCTCATHRDLRFTVVANNVHRGFLGVSKTQPLALIETMCPDHWSTRHSGEACGFHAVGANMLYFHPPTQKQPTDRLATYYAFLHNLSTHGGNYVRFRVDESYAALEAAPCLEAGFLGAGWYEEQTAWEVDQVHAKALALGVYIQQTLYNENANLVSFNHKHPDAPAKNSHSAYLKPNGGPLDPEDCFQEWWLNPTVLKLVEQKLRYVLARWGYSRNFAMLEIFNENPIAPETGPITRWHAKVGDLWHTLNEKAGYRHLLTSSRYPFKGSAYDDGPAGFSAPIPSLDVAQVHAYPKINQPLGNGCGPIPEFFRNNSIGARRLIMAPLIFGEVGIDNTLRNGSSNADIAYDPHGASLHNPMWATAMGQGSGALFWYSSAYVAQRNLWYHFEGFRSFVDKIPWASASLRSLDASTVRAPSDVSVAALVDEPMPSDFDHVGAGEHGVQDQRMWLWVRNVNFDSSWMLAHQGQAVPPVAAGLSVSLPCKGAGQSFELEWFSTTTGTVIRIPPQNLTCVSGLVRFTLPVIATDVAATLKTSNTPVSAGPIEATVHVASAIFTVAPHYLSYTIDTSAERGFFRRDLTNPKLRWLARQLSPAVLRVGGSGSDELYYDVPHNPNDACPGQPFAKCKDSGHKPPSPAPSSFRGESEKAGVAYCLNQSQWDDLNGFVAAAKAHLVFGLNFFLNVSSDQVSSLLRYTADSNYTVFGYEFGNEQIKAPQTVCRDRQAAEGAALYHKLRILYPNSALRPRLIGPDNGGPISLGYVRRLADLNASLFAYSFHQYSLSREGNSSYIPPSRLMTPIKCSRKAKELKQATKGCMHAVELWAGEAGGTGGGGSDKVTNSFASGIWYLDSLGLYAATGTSVFARQDLVGGFYGFLEDGCPFAGLDSRAPQCTFHEPVPNPDYWSAILWKRIMGERVLDTSVRSPSRQGKDGSAGPWLRAYAHCAPRTEGVLGSALFPPGTVSMVLINTHSERAATVPSISVAGRTVYTSARISKGDGDGWLQWDLRAMDNVSTTKTVTLNGRVLAVKPQQRHLSPNDKDFTENGTGWQMPDLSGRIAAPGSTVTIAPASYSFLAFVGANAAVCKGDDELAPERQSRAKDFRITDFGAVSGSILNHKSNTLAFKSAFDAAARAGPGSRVVVPMGDFFSGPIRFTASDQTLAVEAGGRIIAAFAAYGNMTYNSFKTSWPTGPKEPEGAVWNDQFMPFIYAKNLTRVSLVGPGIVDGGGEQWWNLKNKNGKSGKFPKGMPQRPYNVRFDGCRSVLVKDLQMHQPPFWNLVPTWCDGVQVFNVSIIAVPTTAPQAYNTDGIEPMFSRNVHISHCFIQNGDDSVTVKSGSHNVLVENCVFQDGHGCNIGSIQGEGVSNVTYRNIQLNNTLLGGGRIKARHWVDEWVVVENVTFENISCVPGVENCVDNSVAEIDMAYGGGPFGRAGVTVRNATWRNINVAGGHHAGNFSCLSGNPCTGVVLENVVWRTNQNDFVCRFASGSAVGDSPSAECLNLPVPPPPPPHPPAPPGPPSPRPSAQCLAVLNKVCPDQHGKREPCKTCIHTHETALKAVQCWPNRGENAFVQSWCDGKVPSPSPPSPVATYTCSSGNKCIKSLGGQYNNSKCDKKCKQPKPAPPGPPPSPPAPLAWVPSAWSQKHARGDLVWAVGSDWRGQPWRDDPYTTSRSAQFGNGYVASVLGGPEYVPTAFCAGNRAPIAPTYNASVSGMHVQAVAMDLQSGVVQQLWCVRADCRGGPSVMQTTYASEASPHLVISEFVLNNSHSSSRSSVRVDPAAVQPAKSRVGPGGGGSKYGSGAECMHWTSTPLELPLPTGGTAASATGSATNDEAQPSHTLSVGELSVVNKKGGSASLAVVAHTSSLSLSADAGAFSTPQIRCSSRWSSVEAGGTTADAVAAATAEYRSLVGNASLVLSLRQLHEQAFATRRLRSTGKGPITVTGSSPAASSLGLLLNASWYALMGTAPRPEAGLNRFGTGISSLNTNGYNGRTFWDMDTWVAPNWLLFGPDKAADGALAFRRDEAPIAAQCAKEFNYTGLDFPWDIAFGATPASTSKGACPENGQGHTEIHIGGDIAFLAYQRWMATHDVEWLKSTGWPLIAGVAKYYAARATPADNDAFGSGLIYKDASGPDESGASNSKRGGSVYVAVVAKISIAAALELAPLVGDSSFPASEIAAKGAAILVGLNHSFPSSDERGPARNGSWHPEYLCTGIPCTGDGYQLGQHIKQADVTMLNFPFGWPMEKQTLSNDLTAYPITKQNAEMEGMNIMSLVVGWRDAGNDTLATELYANLSTQLIDGPFFMWMEKTRGESGAPNYLTSPGGWLQATWAGWGGLRLTNDSLFLRSSRPPPGCDTMTMHSVRYRGNLLDILVAAAGTTSGGTVVSATVTVTLLPGASATAEQLSIVVGGAAEQALQVGVAAGPLPAALPIAIRGRT